MSQYSIADTERVYRIAREYVEETQRYVRMIRDADPGNGEVEETLHKLDLIVDGLAAQKEWWQADLKDKHNPDWDVK